MKFTKAAIEKRPAPMTGEDWEWDALLPGFGLKIPASGRKTFVVRYRTAAGQARKQTIGRADVLGPETAREIARNLLAAAAQGRDPMLEKQQPAEQPTMLDMHQRYMAEHAIPHKKERSVDEDARAWSKHILPALGGKLVVAVTKADVMKLHAKMKDTPAAANYVVAVLGKAFSLAEGWGWRAQASNPCYKFKKFKIKGRTAVLTVAQMGAINDACSALVLEGGRQGLRATDAALIRLWMLTGTRNAEMRLAKREWIDREARGLRLPDSKTGERFIPLPDAAFAIIDSLPAGEWLFPGSIEGQPLKQPYSLWRRVCERAGVPVDATPHTLRHSVGTLGHHAGLSQKQIADQLGHANLSTTAIYLHPVTAEQAAAAEKLAAVVTAGWKA